MKVKSEREAAQSCLSPSNPYEPLKHVAPQLEGGTPRRWAFNHPLLCNDPDLDLAQESTEEGLPAPHPDSFPLS